MIGNTEQLPESVRTELDYVIDQTQNNTEMTLTLALSYGGREELANVLKQLALPKLKIIQFHQKKLINPL